MIPDFIRNAGTELPFILLLIALLGFRSRVTPRASLWIKAAPEKVCESCHKGHAQFGHPIGKGVIDPRTGKDTSCASCHSPHGTGFPALLTHSPQRSLCVQCHAADGTVGTRRGVSGGRVSE